MQTSVAAMEPVTGSTPKLDNVSKHVVNGLDLHL